MPPPFLSLGGSTVIHGGIVRFIASWSWRAVRDEIIRALEAFVDPKTGRKVVKKVFKREEIFRGDYWKEGEATFTFYGIDGEQMEEKRSTPGFADLYIGFNPKYRVSWGTSLGGLEESTIIPNKQKWSADHTSVDPSEVPGIFICNRKIKGESRPSLVDIVSTVLDWFEKRKPENLDGEPIPLDL